MRFPSDVSLAEIKRSERNKLRPTVKCIFYNSKGEIFFFHRERRVSFPGGGVDGGEKLHEAALREIVEELFGVLMKLRKLRESCILKVGKLPTTKPWWKGKKVYVLAVYLKDLHAVTVKDESHYDFKVLPIALAITYIDTHEATPEVSRKFYVAALCKLARLKGWKI